MYLCNLDNLPDLVRDITKARDAYASKKLGSEKILGTRKFLVKRNFGSLTGLEEQSCRHLLDTFKAPNKIPSKHLPLPRRHLPDT